MKTKKSRMSLAIWPGPEAEDGKRHVIACGYQDDKFGYFICKEQWVPHQDPDKAHFSYSDVVVFYPKFNETTFQTVLSDFKVRFSDV